MKLLQNNVLGGNKWNCFKAMQMLGGLTQILIWGSKIAKGPTRQIKWGPGALVLGGHINLGGGAYEHQWCHAFQFALLFATMYIFIVMCY